MALQIDLPAPSSISRAAQYWKISSYTFNADGTAQVHFEGYWTAEDRDGGAVPAAYRTLVFKAEPGVEVTRAWIYGEAKQLAEFEGALDV